MNISSTKSPVCPDMEWKLRQINSMDWNYIISNIQQSIIWMSINNTKKNRGFSEKNMEIMDKLYDLLNTIYDAREMETHENQLVMCDLLREVDRIG